MDLSNCTDLYSFRQLDDLGICFAIEGPGFEFWVHYRIVPCVGVYCPACDVAPRPEMPCETCADILRPIDAILSENGDRFRGYVENWLDKHSGLDPLAVMVVSRDIQENIIRTNAAAHELKAREKGWR